VAREVVRRGHSVLVLEARRIAWNASGRNTGFVIPGYAADPQTIIDRVGLEQAKSLWALSETGFDYVRKTSRELPGVEVNEGGWLNVSKSDDEAETSAFAALLAKEFKAAVEFWPTERVREQLKSPFYFGAVHFPKAFCIHTLNYALALAADAEAPARASSRRRRRCKLIRTACASVSSRRVRECARRMWCLPETCISRASCLGSRTRWCRFQPMSSPRRGLAISSEKLSAIPVQSAIPNSPTIIIA